MDRGWLTHAAENGALYTLLYKIFGEQAKRFSKAGGDRLLAGFEEHTKTKQLQARLAEEGKREALAWLAADDKVPELTPTPSVPAAELVLLEDDRYLRGLGERARARVEAQELRRQENIEASFFFCLDEPPPPKTEGTPSHPAPATVDRILEGASNAYDEEAQRLWGRLMANETVNPGRFSLRTLDALRSLSSEEARLFVTACRYAIIDPGILIEENDLFEKASGIPLGSVIQLVEAGLINPDRTLTMRVQYYPSADQRWQIAVLRYFDRFLLIRRPMMMGPDFAIKSYALTVVARELSQLLPQTGAPEQTFLEEFAKWQSVEILDHAPIDEDFARLFNAP